MKFNLQSDGIFLLSPASGTLAPRTHAEIECTFKPQVTPEAYSEPSRTSKMELFAKIVNDF